MIRGDCLALAEEQVSRGSICGLTLLLKVGFALLLRMTFPSLSGDL